MFQELLETIRSLTGLRTCMYDHRSADEKSHPIDAEFRGHRSAFCELVRSTEEGQEACRQSDVREANDEAGRLRQPFLHRCHAGLTEVVIPVFYQSEHVGTIFCGQAVVMDLPGTKFDTIKRRTRGLRIDMDALRQVYAALPRITEDKLTKVGNLLFLAANHLAEVEGRSWLQRAIMVQQKKPIKSAIAYLDDHFAEPLTMEAVARHVSLSPSYFSRLFKQITGKTFVAYLTERRMQEAKKLLAETSLRVTDITFQVGYSHQSYFGRIFREQTGLTPVQYRKLNQPPKL